MNGRIHPFSVAGALLVGVLLVTLGPGWNPPVGAAESEPSEQGDLIAFWASTFNFQTRKYEDQVFTVDASTGEVVQLTGTLPDGIEGESIQPRWSPDGSRIAFVSDRDGDWDIYTMAPDGSDVVQVLDSPEDQWQPNWAPNGKRIAFRQEGKWGDKIHLVTSEGLYLRKIRTPGVQVESLLDWRPCAGKMIFSGRDKRAKGQHSYLVRPGKEAVRRILPPASGPMRWHPGNCKRVAFSLSDRGAPESSSLFTQGIDRRKKTAVPTTHSKSYDYYHDAPAWSPDATRMAYGFLDHGCWECTEIRIYDKADESDTTLIPDGPDRYYISLDWRPAP